MKIQLDFLRFALGGIITDAIQSFFTKLDTRISAMSVNLDKANALLAALKQQNTLTDAKLNSLVTLQNTVVEQQGQLDSKDALIASLQAQLAAGTDEPAVSAVLDAGLQASADETAKLV